MICVQTAAKHPTNTSPAPTQPQSGPNPEQLLGHAKQMATQNRQQLNHSKLQENPISLPLRRSLSVSIGIHSLLLSLQVSLSLSLTLILVLCALQVNSYTSTAHSEPQSLLTVKLVCK